MRPGRIERILRSLIVLFLGVFVWVIYASFHQRVVVTGDSAPSFEITADSGRRYTESDFGGKVLVLNFWATWCPPCIDEFPALSEFAQTMKSKGVVVLAISIDESEKQYREFLARNKAAFETARDPEAKINKDYGTLKVPETYLIDSKGVVRRKWVNLQPWMSLEMLRDVESLL